MHFKLSTGGGGRHLTSGLSLPNTMRATLYNGVARTLKRLRTSTGDYWIKQGFSLISPLFKMGTSLEGKNLLPEGANSFL